MTITPGYELATNAQFRELSNFSTPPRAGRITAIEASGQVRVETDDPDGGDVLAWPLNGFTYAVDDVVYLAFAVNSPDSAIVIGSLGNLPLLDHTVIVPLDHGSELTGLGDDDHTQYALLAGRSGGQTLKGDIASAGTLVLMSTAHGTKGKILLGASAYDEAQNFLGMGTAIPESQGHIASEAASSTRGLILGQHNAGAQGALLIARKSRGTKASPSIITNGDFAAAYFFQFWDGSAYLTTAAIGVRSNGTVGSGSIPTDIIFAAGAADNVSLTNEVARMRSTGEMGIGIAAPGASILGVKAGASTNDAAVGGTLYETRTQAGNVGAGEDDLASYSVPANTLSVDGMSVWFEAAGTCAANLNGKTLRIRFGTSGTNLIVSATVTGSGGGAKWIARGRVVRTGAATQKGYAEVSGSNITTTVDVVTGLNQTLSGAVTLKITGEATSNNDIVLETFRVEWGDANT